jgi:hypothetical protein
MSSILVNYFLIEHKPTFCCFFSASYRWHDTNINRCMALRLAVLRVLHCIVQRCACREMGLDLAHYTKISSTVRLHILFGAWFYSRTVERLMQALSYSVCIPPNINKSVKKKKIRWKFRFICDFKKMVWWIKCIYKYVTKPAKKTGVNSSILKTNEL